MRSKLFLCVMALTAVAYAKDPKPYQTGTLLQMDAVKCVSASSGKNTDKRFCQEYLLQAENVIYRVRPRHEKHSTLLPVGNRAEFRMEKSKMFLRIEGVESKEREYVVISMSPRSDASAADASLPHLNHLQ